jgi:hypothetical protein
MQVFPAGAALAALAVAITGDAVADAVDATELLDVDVDQLARMLSKRCPAALLASARLGLRGMPSRR